MLKQVDKMGVLILMAHLIITLAVIVVYAVCLVTGRGDVGTLSTFLAVIIGYWFGSMGANAIRPQSTTQINQANEVKVNPQPQPNNDEGVVK